MNVTIPGDVTESEVIDSLKESISDVLGVHPSDVLVTIDEEGLAAYSISGNTFTEIKTLQEIAEQDDFFDLVNNDLRESGSEVFVEASSSNEDIEVLISAIVDTTDATGTRDPEIAITQLAQDYDLINSIIEGKLMKISWISVSISY